MSNVKKDQQSPSWSTVLDMPLGELSSRVGQADTLIQQALALFPGLLTMTDQERRISNGRFRHGEGKMYLTVLDVMEAFPAFFEGLADLDEGVDPTKVETPLMRDRLQRAEILAGLLDPAGKLGGVSDTVLHLRSLVRDPLKEAYGIAKSMAKTQAKLRSMLAPVIDFYAALARAAAESRKANEEASAKADAGK